MKNIILITLVILLSEFSFPQRMIVHKNNATTVSFSLAQIDSITFSFAPDTIPTQGLVGAWLFSGNANDSSGNGNHGTVIGATLTEDRFGNSNYAYSFDGIDDKIIVNNVPVNTTIGEYNTVSMWFFWNGDWDEMCFQSTISLWFSDGSGFGINGGNNHLLGIDYSGLVGEWIHVVAVLYNGVNSPTTSKLYINSVRKTITDRRGAGENRILWSTLYFGGTETGQYAFHGLLDDVRVYNRVLTDSEVTHLYHEGGW